MLVIVEHVTDDFKTGPLGHAQRVKVVIPGAPTDAQERQKEPRASHGQPADG